MFRERTIATLWWWVPIISWIIVSPSFAESPQLTLGDKLSVFSDKAYRKNNGRYFEAVGNVVIISQQDTIYGEVASLNQDTMLVKVEGNVRIITKDMTLYGSHVEYDIAKGTAVIKNARILTPNFNIVANELIRVNENEYWAKEAEFTTCKDCAESWSVYGKEIKLFVGKYVQIKHGLAKIKGVNVLYLPYIVLPIQTKRKTGLLFPKIGNRLGEGLAFEQPVFVAIDESKDMTVSPTFWAKRGYGGDLQYRQRFGEMKWMEFNSRVLQDTIYLPGRSSTGKSGEEFSRNFVDVESHQQWTPNLSSHFRSTSSRDLDIVRDHPQYTEPSILSSDLGPQGFVNWRQDYFTLGAEGSYLRNQLAQNPTGFDSSYVQTLPRVTLSSTPYSLVQSDIPMFQHISTGVDGSYTRFRQVTPHDVKGTLTDEGVLRNADRVSTQPYLWWHFLTWGPTSLSSRYTLDQQTYKFADQDQAAYGKNVGLVQTEISFTMDRIFGLAYEEKIPIKYIPSDELKKLREQKEQGLAPIQKTEHENRLVGELPVFESELAKDNISQVRNSYRHSQEFKFIHHYIANQNEYGNKTFGQQITTNRGWFDYEDAVRAREYLLGGSNTRTTIPPQNTLELQWNNSLIRKSPKTFSYLVDDKYLRDNFSYSKIGYFNVSQGYLLNNPDADDYRENLTRLLINTGYSADRWSMGLQEYYFHADRSNVFNANFTRLFDSVNLLSSYSYNSISVNKINSLTFGGQIRPTDVLGFAMLKNLDLEANRNVRTIYSLDIMPNNNCWILSLDYSERLGISRYSFNIMFNFGNDDFAAYRNNYFGVKRL